MPYKIFILMCTSRSPRITFCTMQIRTFTEIISFLRRTYNKSLCFYSTSVIVPILNVDPSRRVIPLDRSRFFVREVFRQDEFELVQFRFRYVFVRGHQRELHRTLSRRNFLRSDGFVNVSEDRGGDVFREGCVRGEGFHHFFDSDWLFSYSPSVVIGTVR